MSGLDFINHFHMYYIDLVCEHHYQSLLSRTTHRHCLCLNNDAKSHSIV